MYTTDSLTPTLILILNLILILTLTCLWLYITDAARGKKKPLATHMHTCTLYNEVICTELISMEGSQAPLSDVLHPPHMSLPPA